MQCTEFGRSEDRGNGGVSAIGVPSARSDLESGIPELGAGGSFQKDFPEVQ